MINREVIQVITDLEPDAHKKQISIELVEDRPVPVVVNAPLVSILIRNIVDNAIKYTPVNGNVLITISGQDRYLELCVEDSGPGIAPEQYEKSLERFHRCVETANKTQGTGLGFSMVQRIASIHNADLVLGVSQFGGLKVKVLFPLPLKLIGKKSARLRGLFKIKKQS
jgi:two-component system sensor histidine kinase QseC